ncbi:hypothetical protein ABBQ38_005217 [Trebouxia sp. C0009 RCD-2024]
MEACDEAAKQHFDLSFLRLNDAAETAYPSKHRGICRDLLDAVETPVAVLLAAKRAKPAANTHRSACLTPSAGPTACLAPAVPDSLPSVGQRTPGAYSRHAIRDGLLALGQPQQQCSMSILPCMHVSCECVLPCWLERQEGRLLQT